MIKTFLRISPVGFVYFGHGVSHKIEDEFIDQLHIELNDFKNVIEFWLKLGFKFVSLNELREISKCHFKLKKPWIHLTFDDGYENNFTVLYPYLKSKNIPFTIFLSTGLINTNRRLTTEKIRIAFIYSKKEFIYKQINLHLRSSDNRKERIRKAKSLIQYYKLSELDEQKKIRTEVEKLLNSSDWLKLLNKHHHGRMMKTEQLLEMRDENLVYIGAHGHNHIVFNRKIPNEVIYNEMKASLNWIFKNLEVYTNVFAYPEGQPYSYSTEINELLEKMGYELCFTTSNRPIIKETNPKLIPRYLLLPNSKPLLKKLIKKVS